MKNLFVLVVLLFLFLVAFLSWSLKAKSMFCEVNNELLYEKFQEGIKNGSLKL